jgi:predicted nuclease with TOPRIM domain
MAPSDRKTNGERDAAQRDLVAENKRLRAANQKYHEANQQFVAICNMLQSRIAELERDASATAQRSSVGAGATTAMRLHQPPTAPPAAGVNPPPHGGPGAGPSSHTPTAQSNTTSSAQTLGVGPARPPAATTNVLEVWALAQSVQEQQTARAQESSTLALRERRIADLEALLAREQANVETLKRDNASLRSINDSLQISNDSLRTTKNELQTMCADLRAANDKLRAARKEDSPRTETGEQAEITRLKSEVARLRELWRKVNAAALMASDGIVDLTGEVDGAVEVSDNDLPTTGDIEPGKRRKVG